MSRPRSRANEVLRVESGLIAQQRGERDGGRPAPPETCSCRWANGGSPGVRPRPRGSALHPFISAPAVGCRTAGLSRPCPVRFDSAVTDVRRVAKRRSTARSTVSASTSAASPTPIGVVGAWAATRVSGNQLVDQDASDLVVGTSRWATGGCTRRRGAGQGANRPGRSGQADAVRDRDGAPCGHPEPHGVALAEFCNEVPPCGDVDDVDRVPSWPRRT